MTADLLEQLRREARHDLLLECRKHGASKLLRSIPWLGPIGVALLLAQVQTPHRFRSKRQFWAYCGLALETRSAMGVGICAVPISGLEEIISREPGSTEPGYDCSAPRARRSPNPTG